MSEQLNLRLGEDWVIESTVNDFAGQPLDLTGVQAVEFRLAARNSTRVPNLKAELNDGVEVVNAATGSLRVTIPTAMQTDFEQGNYDYEIYVRIATGADIIPNNGIAEVCDSLRIALP